MRPNLKLLEQVARITELIPPDEFDMGNWLVNRRESQGSCQTVGCAIGKCCEFGLFDGVRIYHTARNNGIPGRPPVTEFAFRVSGEEGQSAAVARREAQRQLGLTFAEFEYLFMNPKHVNFPTTITPKKVAAHIRRFIKKQRAK